MDTLYSDIGFRIKELRAAHHMTQDNLAEAMDVSIKHVSSVERGMACFSIEKLIELCDVLDTSLDYLVRGQSPLGKEIYFPDYLIETLRSDNDAERRLLQDYLVMYKRLHHIP